MAKRLNKETVNGEGFRFKKWDNNGRDVPTNEFVGFSWYYHQRLVFVH